MFFGEQGFFDCNPACLILFGCTDKAAFLAKHPAELSPPKQACGSDSLTLANHFAQTLVTGSQRFEWPHQLVDTHEVFPVEILFNAVDINGKQVEQAMLATRN